MMQKTVFIILIVLCTTSCKNNRTDKIKDSSSIEQSSLDSILVSLKTALKQGMDKPMQIVTDSNFNRLIEDPGHRPEVRSLLEEYAVENSAAMVGENEPGEPIIIKGKIVDESNGIPLRKVQLELVQTDHEGFYFREKTKWNPRIFAYLVTNDEGEFFINTIRPGKYKDEDGNDVPAHIHFTLKKEGFRTFGGEFTFEDDSVFMANGNVEMVSVAHLINKRKVNEYQVKIPMQRNKR